MPETEYDAVVIGGGPNGLAAAITMQQQGLSVLIIEASSTIGGGARSAELTIPGYVHDICSAIHPLAAGSPFFQQLPLSDFGLEYIYPKINAAHPMDNGDAPALYSSIADTAAQFGVDGQRYLDVFTPLTAQWPQLSRQLLGPLRLPSHPLQLASFGIKGLQPALSFARTFKTSAARALFGGMAAHSIQPLSNYSTTAFGLVLMIAAHARGWPVAKGGSQSIVNALNGYFQSIGGKVQTGVVINALKQLPTSKVILFDTSPDQVLKLSGDRLSAIYKWQLKRFRYGMGTFKIDWALDAPIPFTAMACREAVTIHLGNTLEEFSLSEQQTWEGKHPDKPFVLLAQQSIIDPGRAPSGKHTAWAYCHVPNGSEKDMTTAIENQVERYAPGFRDFILARHSLNTSQLHQYNRNYVGGDINGGVINISQLFTRPALRFSPYRTSAKGLYICSASTPPGGGVHGMCGYHAARQALKDIFHIDIKSI